MSASNFVNGSQNTGGNKKMKVRDIYFYLKEIIFVLKYGVYTESFFLNLYYYLICFLSERVTSDS